MGEVKLPPFCLLATKKEIRYHNLYMGLAFQVAQMSHCERLKVGAIAVKDGRIISMGWNGQPSGMDNCCEEDGKTLPSVLHAENNLLMKLASCHESSEGAAVYITHSPCMECAKLLHQAKVSKVFFAEHYRSTEGVAFLKSLGMEIIQIHGYGQQSSKTADDTY